MVLYIFNIKYLLVSWDMQKAAIFSFFLLEHHQLPLSGLASPASPCQECSGILPPLDQAVKPIINISDCFKKN